MKSVRWFLLIGALGAVGTFTACEKQPESKLKAMTEHHHHEEQVYSNPKAEAEALGETPQATPAHGAHDAHGAPSATPAE